MGPSRPSTSSEKSNSGSPFKGETSNQRPSSARSGGTCEPAGEVGVRPGEKMGELYTMGKSVNPLEEMYQHEPINLGKENSKCENCGKEAHFMCSACKNSHYCSSQCQVNDDVLEQKLQHVDLIHIGTFYTHSSNPKGSNHTLWITITIIITITSSITIIHHHH